MAEPQPIMVEQRAGQGVFLIGEWPRTVAFDVDALYLMANDLPHRRQLRPGRCFWLELQNARARYRYDRDGRFNEHLICVLVRGERH